MKLKTHLITLASMCAASAVTSAATVVASENFDALTASSFPGTSLAGQGGWVSDNGSLKLRNDYTTGSFDGNVAYNGGGAAIMHRYDGASYLTATDTSIIIEITGRAATNRLSRAGVAYDNAGTSNPGIYFGSGSSGGWSVYLGSGTTGGSALATSTNGLDAGGDVFDMRLTIDLVAETGHFEFKPDGGSWTTPTGMGSIDLSALDTGATDGTNPLNWNSLYIRTSLAGDTIDNIVVSAVPEPSSAALLGLGGLALLFRRRK
ncbi:MAG: PEP-CTERM sorting domain-containing protein [Akkermansiaceae bacterium]|nr:PEP-CTERM sorting domain-containing protein [Akkermansiaceae bacterium]